MGRSAGHGPARPDRHWPGTIRPQHVSANAWYATPAVWPTTPGRSGLSHGVHPPSGSPVEVQRDVATARPSSGDPDDTGQSDPKPSGAPELSRVRIGYCRSVRSRPRRGTVNPSSTGPAGPIAAACSESPRAERTARDRRRPPTARARSPAGGLGAIADDGVLDRVERLTNSGIADGVDVNLQSEFVDPPCRLGE